MRTENLIDGVWIGADSGATFDVCDPATDEVIATVPNAGAAETRRAIESAARAQKAWARRPAAERRETLLRFQARMLEREDEFATLLTREQGKPLAEAAGEIRYAASFLGWAAGEATRVYGETIPASHADKRIVVMRQPVGVTAAITPWNFPAAMITRKLGPALAAGCAMVVKPAEQTPLSALALGEIALDAGLPPGLFNLVTGAPEAIGGELLDNQVVRKLSFTGSTEVGKLLMRRAAGTLTRLSLELGGHAPFIVFEDADVSAAVRGALASKFRNMGQTCICPNRFFVHRSVYDQFCGELQSALETMKIGHGLAAGTSVGPLIDDDAVAKVRAHVEDALSKGASLRMGGALAEPATGHTNRFYRPTILEDVDATMRVYDEETFGPVAPITRFEDEDEVIEAVNASRYGLAAYFYTRDVGRVFRVAEALEYGIVGANDGGPSTAQAPFGGLKESGFGREGGRYAMHEYLDVKYVSVGL